MFNVIAFNSSLSDFDVVEEMNKNEFYCRPREMSDIYSIGNANFSMLMNTLNVNNGNKK